MASCTVRIVDHPNPSGVAVCLSDENETVVVTVDGNQLDEDPRGVMAELSRHLDLCAKSYSSRAVSAA